MVRGQDQRPALDAPGLQPRQEVHAEHIGFAEAFGDMHGQILAPDAADLKPLGAAAGSAKSA